MKIINSKEYNNIFLYNKLLRIYVKNIIIISFFIKNNTIFLLNININIYFILFGR